MAKTPSSNTLRKASGKAKSSKSALAAPADRSPAVEVATRLDEDCIRERAYGIWIAEGRPDGREHAHWRRAHQELQREAQ